jgi:hypothetical protein
MKTIIKSIMSHASLVECPPVFLDIGASGALPKEWKCFAPYSICVAFDADTRDFSVTESENRGWKRLYTLNRLVVPHALGKVDFYLTKSPYCSSSLPPDKGSLEPWAFKQLFEVEECLQLPAVDLNETLTGIGVDYIDWFKADTQGTDLRIFRGLAESVQARVVAADFEPGLIDAYIGEDKLHHLLAFMDEKPFWVSKMEIKGTQRIDEADLAQLNSVQRRSLDSFLIWAPGWCEISYLNSLETAEVSCREYLLAWMFSSIKGQHGFALHVARQGGDRFQLALFQELYSISRRFISSSYLGYAEIWMKNAARLIFGKRQRK